MRRVSTSSTPESKMPVTKNARESGQRGGIAIDFLRHLKCASKARNSSPTLRPSFSASAAADHGGILPIAALYIHFARDQKFSVGGRARPL